MPTPIAHSLVSMALSDAQPEGKSMAKWMAFCVILGNFADLDFLPGILLRTPSRFHHGFTHSILFAVILACVAAWCVPRLFKGERVPFWILLGITMSHLLLDCLTLDTVAPYGLPLLWPFSHTTFRFPFSLFLNVNRGMSLRILLSWHNFLALCLEVAITLPLLLWTRMRRGHGFHVSGLWRFARRGKNRILSN